MAKPNKLANECANIALTQLTTSYIFKLPRINQIRKYRALYNNQVEKQYRIRYNAPIPIFSGMIDTLQADQDDVMIIKYNEDDPADWKAAQKANAAIKKESESARPGAMWNQKFRAARKEMSFTGRGFLKFVASSDNGFTSELTAPVFENVHFEPKGGGQLENHLFCGETDIWKTKKSLEDAAGNLYNAEQVKNLITHSSNGGYKPSSQWENYDFANRFLPLGLSPETGNYVGEEMFNLAEWFMTYKGERWYLVFDVFSGIWVSFEKLTDVHSSGYYPLMSMASHEDPKNFASKGFADDLYPQAKTMTEFFNEDLENRKRRNSNGRAFDKDMFPNVAQLDEAQMGRDRLVAADTKGGTRRIADGIYQFQTPEISGTLEVLQYLESMAGRSFGVTDLQQGQKAGSDNKVGITLLESQAVGKRLSFQGQPFIEIGQQLGMRFFGGLKDYLHEPLSIKLYGENGYEWDTLRRIDLNVKKNFEITVVSQSSVNKTNELNHKKKMDGMLVVRDKPSANPNINARMSDEYVLRDAGWTEAEIALILDPKSSADKNVLSETSAAIQDIMRGKMPKKNWNATGFYLETILDFVKTHQDDVKVQKHMQEFMDYIAAHEQIAADNEARRAHNDAMEIRIKQLMASAAPPPEQPAPAAPPTNPAMQRMQANPVMQTV